MSTLRSLTSGIQKPLEINRPGTETRVSDLPFLVLAEIFDFFKNTEQQRLRLVSPAWNHAFCHWYEISFRMTHKNRLTVLRSDVEIINAKITSRTRRDYPFETKLYKHVLFPSFCDRLRKLEFVNLKFDINCLRILQNAVSLHELRLSGIKSRPKPRGMNPSRNPNKFRKWLPMLRKLELDCKISVLLLKVVALVVGNGKLTDLGIDTLRLTIPAQVAILEFIQPRGYTKRKNKQYESIINSNKTTLKTIRTFGRTITFENNELRKYYGQFRIDLLRKPQIEAPWFGTLAEQHKLEELDLQVQDISVWGERGVEDLGLKLAQIIARNVASLTKIALTFYGAVFLKEGVFTRFNGIFSRCVSLKALKLEYFKDVYQIFQHLNLQYFNPLLPHRANFREIEYLPPSLVEFSTDFPILATCNSLEDLILTNLRNLETLRLSCVLWFIFNGTPVTTFTTNHAKLFKQKLPKLKTLSINTANARSVPEGGQVEPELVQRFADTMESLSPGSKFIHIDASRLTETE